MPIRPGQCAAASQIVAQSFQVSSTQQLAKIRFLVEIYILFNRFRQASVINIVQYLYPERETTKPETRQYWSDMGAYACTFVSRILFPPFPYGNYEEGVVLGLLMLTNENLKTTVRSTADGCMCI